MPEFEDSREQLNRARRELEAAREAVNRTRNRLKRIAAREAELARTLNEQDGRSREERERLRVEREQAEADLHNRREQLDRGRRRETEVAGTFSRFTDPAEGIQQLRDEIPILMMPLRLETRFKSIRTPDRETPLEQLWVRVFPDDCWIDSFDPTLTEAEVADAKVYWTGIWKAGGVEEQERGAWQLLASNHGSGRARWITSQTEPAGPKPVKPRAVDVVLVVSVDAPLPADEDAAIASFWKAAWLADRDAAKLANAKATLDGAVGAARAEEIINTLQPVNFSEPLAEGINKPDVNLSVAVMVFPQVETRASSWSQPPRVNILPDRFVFLGYEQNPPAAATVVQVGPPVSSTLILGPDPSAPKEDQLQPDDAGNLIVPDDMKWLTNFDRAVEVGMGFRIDLTAAQAERGFKRVLVVGLRLGADEKKTKEELETLLRHHFFSRTGLELVPQGTPTNNTEAVGSGFPRFDDPDRSFNDNKKPLFSPDANWLDKRDGQWLAEYLGIDPAVFHHVHNAGCTDQLSARAMNIALWPATFGYWMESMMTPVFSPNAVEQAREFFNRYVVGAGGISAVRIGRQPYGILPATAISRMNWIDQRRGFDFSSRLRLGGTSNDLAVFIARLYPILRSIYRDWTARFKDVSAVGKGTDPHRTLLDIVGLHPGSVEWSQRYAESLETVFNRLNLMGLGGVISSLFAAKRDTALRLIHDLGVPANVRPLILDKVFSGRHFELKGGTVDDKPLSETEPLGPSTQLNKNYLQWLIDAANASINTLYNQAGFKDDKPPRALLYLLLRHALQLGYYDVNIRLRENAGLLTAESAAKARVDNPFLHVRDNNEASESRYEPLYATAQAITGNTTQPLHEFIAANIPAQSFTFNLREQLAALERLKTQSTARLERALADHLDCCSYRLDSWILALVNYQLSLMRNISETSGVPPKQGIYLGGYAWLEDLAPEGKNFEAVPLTDPGLIEDFGNPNDPPLMKDPTNQGYVHAPSLNHAVAASVLRNGFISDASPKNQQTMAVNLTSERVRIALSLLRGIQAGQGLADLLGYQFERGLHDRHGLAEVDKFIFKLRRAFPLRADKLKSTQPPEGVSIESIEARNVIDGLALIEHIKATNKKEYPFGKTTLPFATDDEKKAIQLEVDRLLESHDAVADLALSEGVYQAVLGNYDRVAATYDAYARGNFPPEPDVVRTPTNGIGLTHRVALHLEAGASPNNTPIAGLAMTPRAMAEPALNSWLATILPDPENISCLVKFFAAATNTEQTQEITLKQLGLQPADLIAIIQEGNEQAMSELDDRVVRHVVQNFGPRPDKPIRVLYLQKQAAPFSVFEVLPLIRNIRRLTTKSRPLKATDLALGNEAKASQDTDQFVDIQRLVAVRNAMDTLRTDLVAFQAQLEGPLSDLANRKNEILTKVDQYVDDVGNLLSRASLFVVRQAGWGFAYDFRNRTFAALLRLASDLVARWNNKLAEFNALLLAEAALPLTATDEERFALLVKAEQTISTIPTLVLPVPATFRNDLVNVKQLNFTKKRDDFDALKKTTRTKVSQLLTDLNGLLPITDFELVELSTTSIEDAMVQFTEDAFEVVKVVIAELTKRLADSKDLFDQHTAAVEPATRVQLLEQAAKVLLESDFRIFPEFSLQSARADEFANALNASRSEELFEYLINPPPGTELAADPFPVDTWLHGVARVREKMFAWEQMMMFTGSLGKAEPDLQPMQFPFQPGDRWLGLEFPANKKLDQDRLLYTAHLPLPFNKAARQCGLLLDEWTETIPTATVDTGITFHYDRPNCEAPQTMLLVTPSAFRGTWQWQDLIDALNETFDFAKQRAIEPRQIDASPYAPFLPATIMASQVSQLTIAANLALNNEVGMAIKQ